MVRKTTFLSLVILFICLDQTTQSNPLDVLRFVCDIKDGMSEDVTINSLPPYCTAVATSQNNEDVVKNMSTTKTTTIPFIQYYTAISYEDWDRRLSDAQLIITAMKEDRVNGIIFDKLYQEGAANFDVEKNRRIYTFFQELKNATPNGLFGLALPRHADILPNAFDYNYLNEVVDFYVIQTINYKDCEYEMSMKRTCTVGDMEKSLKALKESISLEKVLLTVQVYSIGITSQFSFTTHGEVLITYSDGRLVPDYGMLGAYIQFIDYDDFAGCCGCKNAKGEDKFSGTSAIITGMDPNGVQPEDCKNFGNYKGKTPSPPSSEQD